MEVLIWALDSETPCARGAISNGAGLVSFCPTEKVASET